MNHQDQECCPNDDCDQGAVPLYDGWEIIGFEKCPDCEDDSHWALVQEVPK